jgi:DegV family protein with EDD domain
MQEIRIVVDSGSDVPFEVAKKYGIKMVPLSVTFGTEEYKDQVTITHHEFYKKLHSTTEIPFTTQPSPADFMTVYEELKAEGAKHIIVLNLSSKMSGTHQSAVLASNMIEGVQVKVIDSKSASMGYGLAAIEAAEMAAAGEAFEKIINRIEFMLANQGIFFVVDTLEYLAKHGRIARAKALLGGILNIKPILTITEGEVSPHLKARGKKSAIQVAIKEAVNFVAGKPLGFGIVHGDSLSEAEETKADILRVFPDAQVHIWTLGTTIGTHVGPGTIGVIAFAS